MSMMTVHQATRGMQALALTPSQALVRLAHTDVELACDLLLGRRTALQVVDILHRERQVRRWWGFR